MAIPSTRRLELLSGARDKALALLEGLRREEPAVQGFGEGEHVLDNAIDAVSGTLDNLNQALQGAASSK